MTGRRFLIVAAVVALALAAGCGGDTPVTPGNHAPHIQGITANPPAVPRLGRTQLAVLASDADPADTLHYRWSAPAGVFSDSSEYRITWKAPDAAGVFRIKVVVSDGRAADSTSINVSVGSGTVYVTSNPSGFAIWLDNEPTGKTTPDSLEGVPVGTYTLSLGGDLFRFAPSDTTITVGDSQLATVAFRIPPVSTELVESGSPVDVIGGLAYTRFGLGVVYAAGAAGDTTLRSTSLTPTHTGENGRILAGGVRLLEPISLRRAASPAEVAFVQSDQIRIASLIDGNNDGLMDSLADSRPLAGTLTETFAPAFNASGTLLGFAITPSTFPATDNFVEAGVYHNARVSRQAIVTQHGNSLSFGPDPMAVYVSAGEIYRLDLDTLTVWPATQITQTGGTARSPAVSPDGRFVAYLEGTTLKLLAPEIGKTVTLMSGVDTYQVAWRPDGRELLIADNSQPGNARLKLVYNLPIH